MSTLNAPIIEHRDSLPQIWQKALRTSRTLSWVVAGSVGLFLVTIVLNIVDSRVVTGAPVWIKPMKFAISITLYTATLIWMLSFIEGRRRLVNIVALGTAVGFIVEYIAIFLQAARGVRSHFNLATPFDAVLFGLMGNFVVLIWLMNLLAAFLLMRQRLENRPFAWSLRVGLLITAFGAGLGFFMTSTPSEAQRTVIAAGGPVAEFGAHSVGVEDGGAGLPFTNWSVEGGDLRVPHFVGLHALQILPLLGIVLNRHFSSRLSERRRTILVLLGGAGYAGFVALLLWQALRGQPVITPDAATLTALGGLAGALLLGGTAVFINSNSARIDTAA